MTFALLVCIATTAPRTALAQQGGAAAARPLFEESRALMREGHYEQACPKLEAASKLYAGSGILLNLADCYEHVGRLASAWRTFGDAATTAVAVGRKDDEAEARRRRSLLETRLPRLVIHVERTTTGLVLTLDGTVVERSAWSEGIPVDPGSHAVSAESPGRFSWLTTTPPLEEGKNLVIDVPELQGGPVPEGRSGPAVQGPTTAQSALPAGPPPAQSLGRVTDEGRAMEAARMPTNQPPAESPSAERSYWSGQRVLGATVTGVGLAAIGVSAALAATAKTKFDTATGETGSASHDDSVSAVSTGNVATGVLIGGAVAATAGLVLWLTASRAPVSVGMSTSGLVARGSVAWF